MAGADVAAEVGGTFSSPEEKVPVCPLVARLLADIARLTGHPEGYVRHLYGIWHETGMVCVSAGHAVPRVGFEPTLDRV